MAVSARVIFVLGGPGAGKGTQCHMLADTGRFVHLSAGELLREERKSGSPDAELIESYIVEGKIVPAKVTVALLRKAMISHGWSEKIFLIDGFPRNIENYSAWQRDMTDVEVVRLLFLDCPPELMIQRIMSRDAKRSDDNLESLRKRLGVFQEETIPIVELFRERNMTVEVESSAEPQEVNSQIMHKLHIS